MDRAAEPARAGANIGRFTWTVHAFSIRFGDFSRNTPLDEERFRQTQRWLARLAADVLTGAGSSTIMAKGSPTSRCLSRAESRAQNLSLDRPPGANRLSAVDVYDYGPVPRAETGRRKLPPKIAPNEAIGLNDRDQHGEQSGVIHFANDAEGEACPSHGHDVSAKGRGFAGTGPCLWSALDEGVRAGHPPSWRR
jgi:hypothetical protein